MSIYTLEGDLAAEKGLRCPATRRPAKLQLRPGCKFCAKKQEPQQEPNNLGNVTYLDENDTGDLLLTCEGETTQLQKIKHYQSVTGSQHKTLGCGLTDTRSPYRVGHHASGLHFCNCWGQTPCGTAKKVRL